MKQKHNLYTLSGTLIGFVGWLLLSVGLVPQLLAEPTGEVSLPELQSGKVVLS